MFIFLLKIYCQKEAQNGINKGKVKMMRGVYKNRQMRCILKNLKFYLLELFRTLAQKFGDDEPSKMTFKMF